MGDKELFVVLYLLLGDKRKTEEKALRVFCIMNC